MNKPSKKKRARSSQSSRKSNSLPAAWVGILAAISIVCLLLGLGLGYLLFSGGESQQIANSESVTDESSESVTETETVTVTVTEAEAEAVQPADPDAPRQQVLQKLEEGISLIDQNSLTLLAHSLFPAEIARLMESSAASMSRGSRELSPIFDETQLDELKWHLQSSLQGDVTFNDEETIAEIKYRLLEPELSDFQVPENLPSVDKQPKNAVSGFGDDLKAMLTKAADLVENNDLEEFVKHVYPLSVLASLENGDAMQRHLSRISNPVMQTAMMNDLKKAANAQPNIQGNIATIPLPPVTKGDPQREIKFEQVNGNWRFIDSNKQARVELVRLASFPPIMISPKDEHGTFVLNLTEQGWRLSSAAFMY